MPVNDTGMGARDNIWDVSATIPDSAAVESVKVMCGKKFSPNCRSRNSAAAYQLQRHTPPPCHIRSGPQSRLCWTQRG